MVTSGIPSARKKLARAKFHLDALDYEIHAFRKNSPYEFDMTSLGNEPFKPDFRINVTVSQATPVPELWALITGDILTNARGALDHAVFPHIRAKKPGLDRKHIQYPIDDRKSSWENKIRWFEGPVLKVVGESQPYRDSKPAENPLRVLRELVNMDKHRDLIIANYSVDDFQVAPQDFFKVVSRTVFITEMVPGARVAKAHLQLVKNIEGQQWKQFPCYVEFGESIQIPGDDVRWNLLGEMRTIVRVVGQLLDELEQAGC
jgi:hypothetical protein